MKRWHLLSGATVLVLCGVLLAAVGPSRIQSEQHLVAKGDVFYASFRQPDGQTIGWTSVDNSKAVPGGNGSWNEHRYAELYDNFLVVTKPSEKCWGTLIIPTSQLLQIHFRDQ